MHVKVMLLVLTKKLSYMKDVPKLFLRTVCYISIIFCFSYRNLQAFTFLLVDCTQKLLVCHQDVVYLAKTSK